MNGEEARGSISSLRSEVLAESISLDRYNGNSHSILYDPLQMVQRHLIDDAQQAWRESET